MKKPVCEKEEKQKNGFPANRKTVFFLFHLNLAGREKTAPIMKQKATNPIAATSPSKIERNAEVSSETHIVRDMKTHTETLPTILSSNFLPLKFRSYSHL